MTRELKSLVRWQWLRFGDDGRPRLSESLASIAGFGGSCEDKDEEAS